LKIILRDVLLEFWNYACSAEFIMRHLSLTILHIQPYIFSSRLTSLLLAKLAYFY